MIGLDTNVLVRHLTQDDPVQSPQATRLIERQLTAADPGFVSVVVLVELVWVLQRAYGFRANKIAAAVELMLATDTLVIEREQEVFQAMIPLKDGRGSFSDALVSVLGTAAGCSVTVTFDERALRLPGFARVA